MSSCDWDFTTTKPFLQSKRAQFWPEYWESKAKAVSRLNPECHRGMFDSGQSWDFFRSVPLADEWTARRGFSWDFPHNIHTDVDGAYEFSGGLLRGVLLYDELLWDAFHFEREIMSAPYGLDEQGNVDTQGPAALHDEIAKSAAVTHLVELMQEGLIVPHCGDLGVPYEQEAEIDREAACLARDHVIQNIVADWHYEDINADRALPTFIETLAFSQKYNASIISRSNEEKLYDRILWHYSKNLVDKNVQRALREVLSVSLPTYRLSSIDQLIGLKKDACVRHFKEKVWSLFASKAESPDQSSFELVRELDDERRKLSEAIQSISKMKLAWSVATLLVSPMVPFPLNLGVSGTSLAAREVAAKLLERKHKKKFMWIFTIDRLRRLFLPWESGNTS